MRRTLITLLSFSAIQLTAQTPSDTVVLESFTIQGNRTMDSTDLAVRPFLGMNESDWKNNPQPSVQEGLNQATGIDLRSRGPAGVQSDLSIRGGSFDQGLAMINGIKLSDPQTGHHMMDLPILPEDVSQVEQMNNGGSRWFGPYAFSGSVNFLLKEAQQTGLELRLSGGDFGYFNGSSGLNLVNSWSSTTIRAGRSSSDGYQINTDFINDILSLRSVLKFKRQKVYLFAGQTNKQFGAQNFYTVNYPFQYEETKAQLASVRGEFTFGRWTLSPQLAYRRHTDEFQLYRTGHPYYSEKNGFLIMDEDTVPSWYSGPNYHLTNTATSGISMTYRSIFGNTHFGIEYREEEIYSNNLGEKLDEKLNGPDNAIYTKYAQRFNTSVFVEQNKILGPLALSVGVLANQHSDFGRSIFPGADVQIRIIQHLKFFTGINYNTRFPTYTDLYYNLGGAVGSIDLKPEYALNYQAGVNYQNKGSQAMITGFVREGKQLIDWIRLNGSTTTQAANLTAVTFRGLEFDSYLDLSQTTESPITGLTLRATYMEADQSSEGFESNYVLDYLRYKLFLGLHHRLTSQLQARWSFRYQDREGGYTVRGASDEIAYDPFGLVDVRIYQEGKTWGWYLEASNLFNTTYQEIGGVTQAGRWLRAGLTCHLNFPAKGKNNP